MSMISANTRTSIGIALAWTGIPVGMNLNYLLPIIGWSPVIMTLSILLIVRYYNLFTGKLTFSGISLALIFYQILMLIYGLFSENMTTQYLTFHMYIIALVVALATNSRDRMESAPVIEWTFIVSGVCSVLGAVYLWRGLIVGEQAWQLRQENEDYVLEIFVVSAAALINFASVLYFPSEKYRLSNFIIYPVLLADIYVVFFGGKRTPLIVMIAILVMFLIKRNKIRSASFYVYSAVAILVPTLFYFANYDFREKVDNSVQNTISGLSVIFGNVKVSDESGSAYSRYEAREWAYDHIVNDFTLFNSVFGGGYMLKWLDNPLLQSYLDMGVLGFLGYFFLVIVYPLSFMLKRRSSTIEIYALSFCIHGVLSAINSGNPYMYLKYVPIAMLSFFASGSSQDRSS